MQILELVSKLIRVGPVKSIEEHQDFEKLEGNKLNFSLA
jgi:hypothetical protein